MHKRLAVVLVLGAALAAAWAGIATAYTPTIIKEGNLELILNSSFSPTKLPRSKMAPIHLDVSSTINTIDGSHTPAMRQLILETDKNGTIDAKGLPVCTAGKLVATETKVAEQHCKSALVGKGQTTVDVAFAESTPFLAKSKLLAFNGGVKGGVTTILIHAYLSSPVSAAVVTTVKVTKINHGPYGDRSVATIPVIAGGAGSVKEFNLEFFRTFTYKHKPQSYLLAKCPDGKQLVHAEVVFAGDDMLDGRVSRPCTPNG